MCINRLIFKASRKINGIFSLNLYPNNITIIYSGFEGLRHLT